MQAFCQKRQKSGGKFASKKSEVFSSKMQVFQFKNASCEAFRQFFKAIVHIFSQRKALSHHSLKDPKDINERWDVKVYQALTKKGKAINNYDPRFCSLRKETMAAEWLLLLSNERKVIDCVMGKCLSLARDL